jgi:glycerol-3-phosphate dehydrogenase
VAFTPDEEIGRGVSERLPKDLRADFAYTLDGGQVGEIEYESFSADRAVVTVTGGKLTTFRRMARDVVDLLTDVPCTTHERGLVGAVPGGRPGGADPQPGHPDGPLPPRLVRRFGAEATAVAALAEGDPALLAPVAPGVPVLGVEALWAVRAEGALCLDDVLDGRLRMDLVDAWRAAAAPAVADLLGADLLADSLPEQAPVSAGAAPAPDRT